MKFWATAAWMISSLVLAQGAAAAEPQAVVEPEGSEAEFDALVTDGLQAYEAGRFEDAAERFLSAYAIRAEPELIYNAARSYEKGLQRRKAAETYERFVGLPGTTAELRAKALDALADLRREMDALKDIRPSMPPPNPLVQTEPPPPVNRTPEIVALSVGGAAAVGAVVLGVLAVDARNQFEDATGLERADLKQTAEDRALAADVLWGTAAVAAVTTTVLFLARRR